jgi:hypothetical protein
MAEERAAIHVMVIHAMAGKLGPGAVADRGE